MEKLYYTIGEVAKMLDESVSRVRFWSNSFSKFLSGKRNSYGNRVYMMKDIEVLKQVQFLTQDCGLSFEGAMKKLVGEGNQVAKVAKAVEKLRGMREQLVEIRKELK